MPDIPSVLLTIAIPTFNRLHLLRQTIEYLLPQLRADVELLICDNCSTDGTSEYLRSLLSVRHTRHSKNIGSDRNFLSCLTESKGQYTWILCDDDLPTCNAVEQIIEARRRFAEPGLIYLRARPSDQQISDYTSERVDTSWELKDRDGFLEDIGIWVTFGSSVVVRRDAIRHAFLEKQVNSNLLPAAIPLTAAGWSNTVAISTQPLLFVRGGNAAGYDAFSVFTRNLHRLLKQCRQFGYQRKSLDSVFSSSMTTLIPHLIKIWRIDSAGLLNLCWYGRNHKVLYKCLIPALAKRQVTAIVQVLARFFLRTLLKVGRAGVSRFGAELHAFTQEMLDSAASQDFRRKVTGANGNPQVRYPIYLKNPQYILIGESFSAGPGLRIEAWDAYAGDYFQPIIKIGQNVCINWGVHIGAINRIEIHDNVLIGSNVLITDHDHGALNSQDLCKPPAQRPLRSKGPVVIERDVWIGEGVSILAGARIGAGAIVGANSVVTADVPAGAVVGGVPARVIRILVGKV